MNGAEMGMRLDAAHRLAEEIRQSAEYREYAQAKEAVESSGTASALLKEYKRLQIALQMAAVVGTRVPQEDMQRFSQMSALLYGGTDTSAFLLAEMRLQQTMSEIFRILTDAAGLKLDLPGIP